MTEPICQCCGRFPGVKREPMWRCQRCLDERAKRAGAMKAATKRTGKKSVKAQF